MRKAFAITATIGALALFALPAVAFAQDAAAAAGAGAGGGMMGGSMSGRAIQLVLMLTVLSLAPGILMTVTSFTRIVVALSLLRNGLGVQGVPPNPVIISLAMFLSFFVMGPTFEAAWKQGVTPYNEGRISETQALDRASRPFHSFMLKQVRDQDLNLFVQLSGKTPASRAELPMTTLMPAFMISELRRAFEIGFLLLLPFLVIDMAVAAVLMAMGMMMLPPATISLPMKIIFFVLVDGWALIAGALVKSFGGVG
ncbi:flagellar type III secretion system pore protein FliP [Sphingobium sp. H39-3-25]|uniref:flagellar type III secretion system pore protein FliP n=1 Tax=Sphingobium arseniciresistens TaxID=3030834 RepID=UPI0023B91909|nr:flagellar type III secretion system pore protein FliP [Sphingobium arseniciresistens]